MATVTALPASATDPHNQQRDVTNRQQQVRLALNLAKASDARVEAEANRLTAAVTAARARLAGAESAAAAAKSQIADAERRIAEVAGRSDATRRALVDRAVQSYMRPFQEQAILLAGTGSVSDYARRRTYLRVINGRESDVFDAYRQTHVDLVAANRQLQQARMVADARAQAEADQARSLEAAQASAQSAHVELNKRVSDLQSESRSLAAQEADLQALIRRQDAAAQAAIASQRRAQAGSGGRVSPSPASRGGGRAIGLSWPVHGPVTSEYGPRWGGFHPGMDIAPPFGTPIHAAASGVVIFAGWYGGYGNFVIVDHGDGIATAYAHQSRIAVSQDQAVSKGDVLGDEGSTGDSTGPHVHFEVRANGSSQNPRDYVPGSP